MIRILLCLAVLSISASSPDSGWKTEIAFQAPDKLGGCAVGDLDPTKPGNEIAAVSRDGRFWIVARKGDGWSAEEVFRTEGEMIQCAIGDADPSREGLEIVAVGMREGSEADDGPGAAYVVGRGPDGWVGERVLESDALLHGVCVQGGAVFAGGYDGALHRVARGEDGWTSVAIGALTGPGKSLVATRGGVAVACADGAVLHFAAGVDGWTRTELDRRKSGRARLGALGDELVVSDDDGTLSLLVDDRRVALHHCSQKLRGAVFADLDPDRPGPEAATVGYTRELVIVSARETPLLELAEGDAGERVTRAVPFVDAERLHHLAAGDLDGDGTAELVACGYSGLLVVVGRR